MFPSFFIFIKLPPLLVPRAPANGSFGELWLLPADRIAGRERTAPSRRSQHSRESATAVSSGKEVGTSGGRGGT